MLDVLTMQDALLALVRCWVEQGCIVTQPMNTEVGAGTLNPATFLRVLGPEPWRVAYVEPSVRPDDSRHGDNPNRIQTHTQFQVILKPEPGDPQDLYLGSLEALGIDVRAALGLLAAIQNPGRRRPRLDSARIAASAAGAHGVIPVRLPGPRAAGLW